jgi:hypothetical protein
MLPGFGVSGRFLVALVALVALLLFPLLHAVIVTFMGIRLRSSQNPLVSAAYDRGGASNFKRFHSISTFSISHMLRIPFKTKRAAPPYIDYIFVPPTSLHSASILCPSCVCFFMFFIAALPETAYYYK